MLEDLVAIFVRGPVFKGGIDGQRQTDRNAGMRMPLDFVMMKINQAGGVTPTPEEEENYAP